MGDGAIVPPGAVGDRGGPVMPFQGHIVSGKLCPIGHAPLSYDAATAELKRLFICCHLAHSRSTLQCKRKNSGSRAAVPMLEMEPPKLVCAEPCGFPSMVRKFG